jgi:hypothetical protein
MSNENQIGTLEEMTKESFANRPTEALEAIEEYIQNLKEENEEKALALEDRLNKDKKYVEQFKIAITHTSLMIFLMSIKASSFAEKFNKEANVSVSEIQLDFDQYVREFLFFSRQDDKEIYQMRLFYLNGLTGSELGLGFIDAEEYDSKDEFEQAEKKAQYQQYKYDELLNSFKAQYMETKVYLNS